ncbi:flagellar brake domain-containing protein [Neptunicella marina]|uniref:Flagellar brake protein n=1 Tax=Neptunicella marina TaxID=2125989 RepID=A0A8J6IRM3_9ALTE|nr:flagellar brake protein [Neptunicella marina]MBC3764597.1 flagellar brake protein [Neptunicella marina]
MAILKQTQRLTLEDLKKLHAMHPGMAVDMQLKGPNAAKRVRSEFIGRDGNKMLMIKFPDESKWGNLRDMIFNDANIVVRYILEEDTGEIVAFQSKVMFVLTKPVHMIFLQFPGNIQLHGLRSTKRASTSIPAKIFNGDNEKYLKEGVIVDMSSTGCRISVKKIGHSEQKLENGEIFVHIESNRKEPHMIKAMIVNSRTDGLSFYYGIKFEQSADSVSEILDDLLVAI